MRDLRVIAAAIFGVAMVYAGFAALSSFAYERVPRPATAVAAQRIALPQTEFRDETAMVLAGAALIGVAAAVRRAA